MIDFLISLDKQINIAIPALRSAWLTKIFYYLTLLGNWPIAAIAVILFSAILWFKKWKKILISILFGSCRQQPVWTNN